MGLLGGLVRRTFHELHKTQENLMTSRLTGTVALVTGASSGIGEATALALAEGGPQSPLSPGVGIVSTR